MEGSDWYLDRGVNGYEEAEKTTDLLKKQALLYMHTA